MSEHFISREDAEQDLLACAAFLGESIQSNDGRAQAMMAVVPAYLAAGNVDLAAELANTVDDPFVRDRLLIAVAEACAAADDEEYAFQLIDALEDSGMKAQGLERVGMRLASQGKIDKARTAAGSMDHQDNVIAGIAASQHAKGDHDEALSTVAEIDFPAAAVHALVAMAADSIGKGENERAAALLEQALGPADEIEHDEERIRAMIDIGSSFTAAEQNDKAIESFERARGHADVLGNVHRDNFLSSIAAGFSRAGSIELADRTLDAVSDKTQIASALLAFSRDYWRRDERADAFEALDEAYSILRSQREAETRDSKARFSLYSSIAVQFAGFEKGERALEVAHEIADEDQMTNALSQIARIMAVQNNEELSRQALAAIPDDAQRAFALIALSETAAEKGETEKAVELMNEANALVEEVPQLASRASAYSTIAGRFFALGDAARANDAARTNLEIIESIRDESNAAAALAQLAGVYENAKETPGEAELAIIGRIARKAAVG